MTTQLQDTHSPDICPACRKDLSFIDNGKIYSRRIGIIEFDRISHWRCPECRHEWGRKWSKEDPDGKTVRQ